MGLQACHEQPLSPRELAKALILQLGVKRVANWCGVTPDAVHQWFARGTDEEPIPPKHVPRILAGASQAKLKVNASVLWPAGPWAEAA